MSRSGSARYRALEIAGEISPAKKGGTASYSLALLLGEVFFVSRQPLLLRSNMV